MDSPERIETEASGGCQCGAVRYHVTAVLDTSHICHCRMCQKAAGNFFAALIGVPRHALTWTRGNPATFNSSDKAARGFCRYCGTPLTYEYADAPYIDLAICAFDDPAAVPPTMQLAEESRIPWCDDTAGLPTRTPEQKAKYAPLMAANPSFQHPDHDTTHWPPEPRP